MLLLFVFALVIGVGVYFIKEDTYIKIGEKQIDAGAFGTALTTFGGICLILQLISKAISG